MLGDCASRHPRPYPTLHIEVTIVIRSRAWHQAEYADISLCSSTVGGKLGNHLIQERSDVAPLVLGECLGHYAYISIPNIDSGLGSVEQVVVPARMTRFADVARRDINGTWQIDVEILYNKISLQGRKKYSSLFLLLIFDLAQFLHRYIRWQYLSAGEPVDRSVE